MTKTNSKKSTAKKSQPDSSAAWPGAKVSLHNVKDLKSYDRNPRTHSELQVDQIAASIQEWGFTMPVLIDDAGMILAGHGRVMAAKQLKLKQVPCIVAAGWSDAQKKAYVIADNKLTINGGWAESLLAAEFEDLSAAGFDMELTGFSLAEIAGLNDAPPPGPGPSGDPDDVPEVPEAPVTIEHDVWLLGNHRLMCGDALDPGTIALLLDGEAVEMVFNDPPYGIGLDKDGQKLGKSQKYKAVKNDGNGDVAKEAFAYCQSMGVVHFSWGANHYGAAVPDSPCWVVWDKQGGKSVTYADCELCFTNIDAPVRMFTHIWDGFRRDSEKGEKRIHPTQKPVQLILDIWEKFDAPATVLDLFGGSGSTLMAAEKSSRVCYMLELDPGFCDMIIQRWQNFTGQRAQHESGKFFDDLKAERT